MIRYAMLVSCLIMITACGSGDDAAENKGKNTATDLPSQPDIPKVKIDEHGATPPAQQDAQASPPTVTVLKAGEMPPEPRVKPPKDPPPTPDLLVAPRPQSERLILVQGVAARSIVDREPVEISNRFPSHVGQVNAFVRIKNTGAPTTATMVWKYGKKEQFRIDLKIGTSPTWRSWSRMTMSARKKGGWMVEILDADGVALGGIPFQIE